MLNRLRSLWLAGGGAALLVLSLSGIVAAAALVADTTETPTTSDPVAGDPAETPDTTLTFEDIDGNGIDDDCQDVAALEDPVAAAAAFTAEDLDGDGTISTSEAAQSGGTGGTNCNHGGYVSGVAKGDEGDAQTEDAPGECVIVGAPVAPTVTEPVVDPAPNAHGKAVLLVAQSDAVGGKNCNHGGAVSEAAKADHGHSNDHSATFGAERAANGKSHGKGHGQDH
jgi:hypothetical protein